jgi:hypothetical protein
MFKLRLFFSDVLGSKVRKHYTIETVLCFKHGSIQFRKRDKESLKRPCREILYGILISEDIYSPNWTSPLCGKAWSLFVTESVHGFVLQNLYTDSCYRICTRSRVSELFIKILHFIIYKIFLFFNRYVDTISHLMFQFFMKMLIKFEKCYMIMSKQ